MVTTDLSHEHKSISRIQYINTLEAVNNQKPLVWFLKVQYHIEKVCRDLLHGANISELSHSREQEDDQDTANILSTVSAHQAIQEEVQMEAGKKYVEIYQ